MINDTTNPAHHPSAEFLSQKRDTFKTPTFKSRKNVCVGCIKYNEKSFSKQVLVPSLCMTQSKITKATELPINNETIGSTTITTKTNYQKLLQTTIDPRGTYIIKRYLTLTCCIGQLMKNTWKRNMPREFQEHSQKTV